MTITVDDLDKAQRLTLEALCRMFPESKAKVTKLFCEGIAEGRRVYRDAYTREA